MRIAAAFPPSAPRASVQCGGIVAGLKFLLFALSIAVLLAGREAAAFSFDNSSASSESIEVIGLLFVSPATWRGRVQCDGRAFHDPRNGGECWQCPTDHKRTVFAVTDSKACQKTGRVVDGWAKAAFKGKARKGCPPGTFRNLLLDQCYSCPAGLDRTLKPGTDLTKMADACGATERFQKVVTPGKSVRGDPEKPIHNVSMKPDAMLRFSAYTTTQCGFNKGSGRGMPTSKPCAVISFAMRANERAVIIYQTTRDDAIASALIYNVQGQPYRLFCNPMQPPGHESGLRCEASMKAVER
jgi:hypothetical protein